MLFVVMFVMADVRLPFFVKNWQDAVRPDEPDTTFRPRNLDDIDLFPSDYQDYLDRQKAFEGVAPEDTMGMDSLQLEVFRHNKIIDDSIRLDSLNKRKKNAIESPVDYSAEDSIVYDAKTKTAHLYGSASVDYQIMNLTSDKMYLSLDSNIVHAMGSYKDSTQTEIVGRPVFKMGGDTYTCDSYGRLSEVVPPYMLGDVDCDGRVTVSDVTLICRYTAEYMDFDNVQLLAGDVNGSGTVTVADATIIQRYLAEYIDNFDDV